MKHSQLEPGKEACLCTQRCRADAAQGIPINAKGMVLGITKRRDRHTGIKRHGHCLGILINGYNW